MIASGVSVAFGAPCCFGTGDGDFCGVVVGDGDGVSDGDTDGVSKGCGDGEPFFFRCGEALDGVGLGVGVGVSVGLAVGEDFFLRRGDEAGNALVFILGAAVGDGVAFGVGVGVGNFFFAVVAVFFFRCGAGVGVAKIFLSVWPRVGSAASFTAVAKVMHVSKVKMRRSISKWLDGEA